MFYSGNVQDTRQVFFLSWKKYREKKVLMPLEKQVVEVIKMHPEYHTLLETTILQTGKAYFPELGQNNPFLHMGFHLALRDQIATNRPQGITGLYQQLVKQYKDTSVVEHLLMDHFAECLWQAQRTQQMPDEAAYLKACRGLLEPKNR